LAALQFHYSAVPLNIIDNGHTVQVNYPAGSTLKVGDRRLYLETDSFTSPKREQVNGKGYDMRGASGARR
jgi:carbonic anhydrase